jgi:hypothetical protein
MKKAVLALVLIGSAVFLTCSVLGLVSIMTDAHQDNQKAIQVDDTSGPGKVVGKAAGSAATSAAPKATKAAPTSLGDGTYVVGKEIAPGTYKTAGAAPASLVTMCVWSVVANDDQDADYIDSGVIDKENDSNRTTLKKGNVFKTTGCKAWIKQ